MYLKTLLTIALLSIFSFLSSASYAIDEIDTYTYQEELEKENNTPIWEKVIQNSSSGGGGGGGGGMLIDNCPNGDFSSSFYDGECGEDIKKDLKEKEDIKNPPISNDITKNEDIKIEDPPKKTIKEILNKEKKQCEPNNLVTARKCRFPSVDIDFIDIEKTFAKNYIQLLGKNGIVEGYYDTRLFKPENTISRAEYLKILLRAFCIDYEDQDVSKIPFSDVVKENWEAKVIAKALELGAINSKNKKFRPHDPLTRAESLKIIFDITGVMPKNAYATKFRDVDEFGWEIKYIQTANDMCIVDGYKVDGQILFKPYKNMNRAEVAKVIANTLQLK